MKGRRQERTKKMKERWKESSIKGIKKRTPKQERKMGGKNGKEETGEGKM